ncbi:MAG: nuclease-related domain-containing protein, partial [Ignavibacteriaceae bacterium]|nr:nuclease-related domain-containing protein [Ignavibacteriaceae bacterium]
MLTEQFFSNFNLIFIDIKTMNNQFRPNNIKPLKEINFETGVNHAKGMDTENSVLKNLTTLCHSLKIDIMRRVIPPYESRVGECDAIIFSDTGILLIEVKRYGGKIMNLSD